MAVNTTNVTFGNAQRGWTSGSISPKAPVSGPISGPVANIPTSGNIPSNILQAVGNLQGEQAFRNFLSNLIVPQQQSTAPPMILAAPNIAGQTAAAQQKAAQSAAAAIQWDLAGINQAISRVPTGFGGIGAMGDSTRYDLQNRQLALRPQLAAANSAAWGVPQMSGWGSGFPMY